MSIDQYREGVEQALEAGVTKADAARALGLPYTTLVHAIERWQRPERVKPGADALEALRRLRDQA